MKKLEPITPGEILLEEFLKPMSLSQYRLAKEIGVPAQRISEIIAGKRSITADTDLRLCRFFGLSNGYWLRAQAAHDTEVAEITPMAVGPSSVSQIQRRGSRSLCIFASRRRLCGLPSESKKHRRRHARACPTTGALT